MSNDGEGIDTFMARRARVKDASGASNGIPLTIAVQMIPGGQHAVTADTDDE